MLKYFALKIGEIEKGVFFAEAREAMDWVKQKSLECNLPIQEFSINIAELSE